MTYPIATIIWGIPQTKEILDMEIPPGCPGLEEEAGNRIRDVDDLLWGDPTHSPPGLGFEGLYSASVDGDDTTGYLGVELWDGAYWEIEEALVAHGWPPEKEGDARERVDAMIELLPEWFRKELPPPGFHIVWSDS